MTIPRYLLNLHFKGDERMIRAMEDQSKVVTDGVAATSALADATVLVLSPNGDFTNERVLQVGDGISIEITDDTVKLSAENVAFTQGYVVTLIPQGETTLFLPLSGTLVAGENPQLDVTTLGNYANDAAAAGGGVVVGQLYRNGSIVMVRVA
jgi:hypothetical protein